jgi:hypothetical protein
LDDIGSGPWAAPFICAPDLSRTKHGNRQRGNALNRQAISENASFIPESVSDPMAMRCIQGEASLEQILLMSVAKWANNSNESQKRI